ncbi:PAS domain-containing hybrid sensor histidine kinase/response regulator [Adhaeribacter aquaticus]|uniref:PAS domain-containing hybrid sensor histidine kinase/response regulator n=1 Tax=Adhaeribacter aquaticus TaxID=299567 RepID=UPI000404F704|nr:PAS domain S-box protein [Adhaeribacter aquaticus]
MEVIKELELLRQQLELEIAQRLKTEKLIKEDIDKNLPLNTSQLHQQELDHQKEYYEAILNNVPSDIVVFDKELRFQYVNPKAFKDKMARDWVIGKTEADYGAFRKLSAEVITRRAHCLLKARDEKQLVEFEETLTNKEGGILYYLRKIQPFIGEDGEVEFVISNGVDITDLKKAQQKVIASEAKNSAILGAIPDLILIVNREGKFIEINNRSQMETVVPEKDVPGNTIAHVLPPALAEEYMLKIQQALDSGGPVIINYSINVPSGLRYREGRIVRYEADKVLIIIRDLTEQKGKEVLLREKDELIRQVMDASPNLIFVKNSAGVYTYVNKAFAEYFGYSPEWIINKRDVDIHPFNDEVDYFQKMDDLVFRTMKEQTFYEKFTKSTGEVIWLITTKKPFVLDCGEIQILGISTNITAEKEAKEKLEKREELYRLLSENSKDMICLHEVDGTYIYISSSVKDLLGYTKEELIGTSPYALTHPDDLDYSLKDEKRKAFASNENFVIQHRKRKKDGTYIWVETNIRPIIEETTGKIIKLQSSSRDISERKRNNEALLTTEKKYKNLIKYSPAYIISHDLKGEILSINPYTVNTLGHREGKVVGKPVKTFLPDEQKLVLDDYLQHLQNNSSYDGVIYVLDQNHQQRFLHFHCYKVVEPGEEPYVIAIGHDLTERLRIEEELKKAKEAAEESARTKENFLANMSHEIRTPLNGILGMVGLLRKTTLDEKQQNYLKVIKSSSDNLLVVINDILDTAKIEAGKIDFEQIPFDINETITAAFNNLKYKAEEKEIAYILKSLPFDEVILSGDPYRLQQVLLNLLNNAIKFTDEGMVSLSVKVVGETPANLTVEFSVRDTGIGIPESMHDTVFEGFTQAYTSTTRKYGGTGLGLNICKSLVELQEGKIWVESQEGLGSIFRFIITYQKSNLKLDTKPALEIDFTRLDYIHVLLAEDNEINIYLAESILKSWGASIDIARNGKEAVELAGKHTYDVILMDIQMPELNGLEATGQIRMLQDQGKANVPIIALTANAIKGDAEKYLSCGMNDYISKPFEEEKLFLTIAGYVKRRPEGYFTEKKKTEIVQANKESSQEEALYNLEYLYNMLEGDVNFINRTISLFIETTPTTVAEMQQSFFLKEWKKVSEAAHKLKSVIDLMQIEKLQKIIRLIERNGKTEENLSEVGQSIELVAEVIHQVIEQVKAERQKLAN